MKRALLILCLALAGCTEPTPGEEAMAEMDQMMRERTDMVRRGVGLEEIFDGQCTEDCGGHRAGYLWAVDNPDAHASELDCNTASRSFNEGCVVGMTAASFE